MRAIQPHVIIFSTLIIILTSSTRAQNNNHELSIAIEEMEKANYFSFVMLINMLQSKNPRFLANVTFLMPKDKTLSRSNIIQQDTVSEFLLRHSIPSPLPFEHLNLIPNGSTVPSSLPDYTLTVSNGGRLNYFLNNVKIISRNICTLGSIKCHGINGILESNEDDSPRSNHSSPFVSCPSSHNNSDHNRSRPAQTHTAPPPSISLSNSDYHSISQRKMLCLILILTVGLSFGAIGM